MAETIEPLLQTSDPDDAVAVAEASYEDETWVMGVLPGGGLIEVAGWRNGFVDVVAADATAEETSPLPVLEPWP